MKIGLRWLLGSLAVGMGVVVGCGSDSTSSDTPSTPSTPASGTGTGDNSSSGSSGSSTGSTTDSGSSTTTDSGTSTVDAGPTCGTGISLCGSACVDLRVDSNNCGTCGTKCKSGKVCSDSACKDSCGGGTPNLCGSGDTARCTSFKTDVNNCGGCDAKCPTGATCVATDAGDGGTGSCACPAGQVACGSGSNAACVPNAQCSNGHFLADCTAIHLAAPSLGSGTYTIDPDGAGNGAPFKVYCDMETEGGGWTLVLKAAGDDTGGQGGANRFDYDSAVWTMNTAGDPLYTFNEASADLSRASAKLASFNTVPFDQVRLDMADGATPRGLSFSVGAQTSARDLFAGGNIDLSKNHSRAEWLGLLDTPHVQGYCNAAGVNLTSAYAHTRLGLVGNNENDCSSPESYIGIGNNGIITNACGANTQQAAVGSSASCNAAGAPFVGGDGYSLAFAWVFVRRSDFTGLSTMATCADHYAAGRTISGKYTIDPDGNGATAPYHVYCDMRNGGWTMVHKFTDGVSADPYAVWTGGTELNAADDTYLNPMKSSGHYLNRIVTADWNSAFTVNQVRVAVFNGETESVHLKFNGASTTNTNFYDPSRVLESSWSDLWVGGGNFFSIAGEGTTNFTRRWFINANYGGCGNDSGWLTVTAPGAGSGCSWEMVYTRPSILFARGGTKQNWTSGSIGHGDTFVVLVR